MNIVIERETKGTYCIIDYIYCNGALIGTQSNTINKNRYGAKEYKRNGKILNVNQWKQI